MLKQLRRSRALAAGPRLHFPLRRLALCLDCEQCFEIGGDTCRACGSETWCTLARFLELRNEGARATQLVVVSRLRPKLYQRLRREFAGNRTVQVVLDRRLGERRQRKGSATPERRRILDRRAADEVRTHGWTVVRNAGLDLALRARLG